MEAGAEPFRLSRFDPINLMLLAGGEVAHASHLTLESPQGTVDVSNPKFARGSFDGTVSLTVPAGHHPLAGGVRHVTVVGIGAPPDVGGEEGDRGRGSARRPHPPAERAGAPRRRASSHHDQGTPAMSVTYRYHHVGIPTASPVEGMTRLDHLRIACTDHESNPFGIQWMSYDADCPLPTLVREVAHVAFEVDNLAEAFAGRR